MSASFYDLLKYAKTGIASPEMTAYDKMRALSMAGGGAIKTLTGVPPLTFKANGKPLISLSMLGNGSQTGTPTPVAPIMPEFCGKLVGTDWTIPITCAGQTQPVYLGQVQTVRRIRKLVLTGEETSWHELSGFFFNDDISPDYLRTSNRIVYCTHYQGINSVTSGSQVGDGECAFYSLGGIQRLYIIDSSYTTVESFTSYLAAQYTAGTPVTIWYVLAEPETTIVNEPLCKIGDYADELHSADAGVSIPTAKGANTLTVDTDLQLSSMTITYR